MTVKHDTEHTWIDHCAVCGVNVEMCHARFDMLGRYCDGCFGWPVCQCPGPQHFGPCGSRPPSGPVQ